MSTMRPVSSSTVSHYCYSTASYVVKGCKVVGFLSDSYAVDTVIVLTQVNYLEGYRGQIYGFLQWNEPCKEGSTLTSWIRISAAFPQYNYTDHQ